MNVVAVVATLLVSFPAQPQSRYQFSVNGSGGLSTFEYPTAVGSTLPGFGGALGADYAWFFGSRWGVSSGVEAALFTGRYALPSFSDSYRSIDGEESFELSYTLTGYSESQQALLLNIPLMLRFEHGKLYAAAGAKVGVRLKAAYQNRVSELTAWGYYPQHDLTLNAPAFKGFGTFTGVSSDGDVALSTAFFASAELGLKWGKLYTGLYLDYGLNDLRKAPAHAQRLVPYELPDPAAYKPQSVLTATAAAAGGGSSSSSSSSSMVDRLRLLAAGVKVAFVVDVVHAKAKPAKTVELVEHFPPPAARAKAERQRAKKEAQRRDEVARHAQRQVEAARHAQRQAEAARHAQRRHDVDMQQLGKPVDGYSVSNTRPTPSMQLELDSVAEILHRYPALNVQIEGHACDIGSHAVNIQIGQRRADAAKAYLVRKGIAAGRITTVSKAEAEPIAPNTSEKNRRKNRRISIAIAEPAL